MNKMIYIIFKYFIFFKINYYFLFKFNFSLLKFKNKYYTSHDK